MSEGSSPPGEGAPLTWGDRVAPFGPDHLNTRGSLPSGKFCSDALSSLHMDKVQGEQRSKKLPSVLSKHPLSLNEHSLSKDAIQRPVVRTSLKATENPTQPDAKRRERFSLFFAHGTESLLGVAGQQPPPWGWPSSSRGSSPHFSLGDLGLGQVAQELGP